MALDWKAPTNLFENRDDVSGVFSTIYGKNVWKMGSGPGSHPKVAQNYIVFLQWFINNNDIKSVVDIGCGDWQMSQMIDWKSCNYLGVDVVPSVIEANTQRFSRPNIQFKCSADFVPEGGDLLVVKDVIQHLSNANVQRILSFIPRFKYALITNDYSPVNVDCENGDTRSLDIRNEPFNVQRAVVVLEFAGKKTFLVMP